MKKRLSYLLHRQIFLLLLLFLLLLCTSCGDVHAASSSSSNELASTTAAGNVNSVDLFKPEEINDVVKTDGSSGGEKITVKNVTSPFLVAVGDFMVALAEVNYTEKNNGGENAKMDVLAKYINTKEGNNWGDDAVKSNNGKWKTQMVTENNKKSKDQCVVKSSAVTVKDNKIYYIAVSNDTFKDAEEPPKPPATEKWHAQLVVGEVNNNNGGKKTIKWSTKENKELVQRDELKGKLNTKPNNMPPSDGVAFAIENEKILFIMKSKAKKEGDSSDEKNVTAIFQLKSDNDENKLELLHVEHHEKCYPSFFKWEGNIIMTPKFCPGTVNKQMKVFDVNKKGFIDIDDKPINRLQAFLEDKMNFVIAIIGGKKVLLLTQKKDPIWSSDVHLWITDGTRAKDVGTIINENEGTFYGSVIYTNDELFVLHQKYKNGETYDGQKDDDKFSLIRLKGLLGNITSTLQAWNKSDKIIPTLCSTIGGQTTSCVSQLPTDGLVGFLHNTSEGKEKWNDECFYTNATVAEGTKVDAGGFKFDGKGAGAKWPVGKKKEDQPYNFTDAGFTLVANVTIETAGKDNSVLGMGYEEGNGREKRKNIGLRCTAKNEWEVIDSEGSDKTKVTNGKQCQQGSTYLVALTLNKNKLSVYINGEELSGKEREISNEQSANITHFYFGADDVSDQQSNSAESYVTVTNVLLYNRPLTEEVIKQLKVPKIEKPNDKQKDTNIPNSGDVTNTRENNETSDQFNDIADNNNNNNGDEGTLSSTPEDSTVRGGVVGVLLFLLLLNICM